MFVGLKMAQNGNSIWLDLTRHRREPDTRAIGLSETKTSTQEKYITGKIFLKQRKNKSADLKGTFSCSRKNWFTTIDP